MGWVEVENLMPGAAEAVSDSLEPGEFSVPIDTGHSFVIVKLHDARQSQPEDFEEFRAGAQQRIWLQNAARAFEMFINEQRANAEIEVHPDRVVIDGGGLVKFNTVHSLEYRLRQRNIELHPDEIGGSFGK